MLIVQYFLLILIREWVKLYLLDRRGHDDTNLWTLQQRRVSTVSIWAPMVIRSCFPIRTACSLTYTHYYHTRRQTFDEWMHLLPPDLSVTTLCHMLKKKVLGYYLIRRAVWSSFDLHHVVLVTNHQSYSWKKERKTETWPCDSLYKQRGVEARDNVSLLL